MESKMFANFYLFSGEMVYNDPMPRVIFIFVDGVGVGRADSGNPFFQAESLFLPFWQGAMTLPDGTPLAAIDAALGIPGPPQSASGQTALFCGVKAREIANRHHNGYPDRHLRKIILGKNLLLHLQKSKVRACFLNAYPVLHKFFTAKHIKISADGRFWFSATFPARFRRMISVTSCMMLAAGAIPFTEKDISAKRALYQDYSNRQLISQGLKLPEYSPAQAAAIIADAALDYEFILYEYFQTDIYAHRRPFADCIELIRDLNGLLANLLARLDKKQDTLVLTSDHGNLEDFHLRGHSRNPVPFLAWGKHGEFLRAKIKSLSDVTPTILELY
jgi:2,3-bisphosphoglycerate-independent phosphoglycerate mutase